VKRPSLHLEKGVTPTLKEPYRRLTLTLKAPTKHHLISGTEIHMALRNLSDSSQKVVD
jgi:hypothetical protein